MAAFDTVSIFSNACNESVLSECPDGIHPEIRVTRSNSICQVATLCLVGVANINEQLCEAVKKFSYDIRHAETFQNLTSTTTLSKEWAFVIDDFESDPDFGYILALGYKLYGPTIVIECAQREQVLPDIKRPLYCSSMRGIVVCFTGFKDSRKDLSRLVSYVHHMGGSVRKDLTNTTTHLVARSTAGGKYRLAAGWGKPIMSEEWIHQSWLRRRESNVSALSSLLAQYKLKPFHGCRISFQGYSADEELHMREQSISFGGQIVDAPECTHLVVDNVHVQVDAVEFPNDNCFCVTGEWFWVSIQLDVCANEELYPVKKKAAVGSTDHSKRPLSPESSEVGRLAKRTSNQLGNTNQKKNARESSGALSMSGNSFLDASSDVSFAENMFSTEDIESVLKSPRKILSKRQQVCVELLQTESNYVQILETIIVHFKNPLETVPTSSEPLLDEMEIKHIFGNLPPIFEVHKKICRDLSNLIAHWREDRSIGSVWNKHAAELIKAYPPFINFFEKTKETLMKCDKTKPRFHAFLKACQSRPECGRQNLQELLIRPVQRLPSVNLLLNDIMKRTDSSNPDKAELEKAIGELKSVLEHINEDKRKTDGQIQMFNIINDIENVPPLLLSSQRQLIASVDVIELTNRFSLKGHELTLYLFNDVLEITKKRQKVNADNSSTSISPLSKKNGRKSHKHLDSFVLNQVKRVIDLTDNEVIHNGFVLVCRFTNQGLESTDQKYAFMMLQPENSVMSKKQFLVLLCHHMANTVCKPDMEQNYLQTQDVSALDLPLDTLTNSLSRAMKFASTTGRRMTRAFSFKKTPGRFQRAVSTFTLAASNTLTRMSRSNLRLPDLPDTPTTVTKQGSIKRLAPSESFVESPKMRKKDGFATPHFATPQPVKKAPSVMLTYPSECDLSSAIVSDIP